jgi:glutamate/tyrosine decarboxylase-like PLP-dependent enzyme
MHSDETLDPKDWEAMRKLGHRMVDDMVVFLKDVRERPVWQPIPDNIRKCFMQPLPQEPQEPEQVYLDFLENVLPYPMGNIHPRFWGWVIGTGTPMGSMAEMLAATINSNSGGGDHIANYVEAQVLKWFKEIFAFPSQSGGLLVNGGSMANLVGLTVARNAMSNFDLRKEGLYSSSDRMLVYASSEAHSSVQKAVELLGLGSDSLRLIPVTKDFEIDISILQKTITMDRQNGEIPFCILGNAGTTNTGAIDDLDALADLGEKEKLWYHVDGAFGAWAILSPDYTDRLKGMERADSLAFDLHKWMYMPFEIGCVLVKDEEKHREAFSLTPGYLEHATRGVAGGEHWFSEYGVELSRNFKSLKAWISIKEHGIQKYARVIQKNIDQAKYLGQQIDSSPHLERLAPIPLNIVCFRFVTDSLDPDQLNELNREILLQLHESGIAVPSYATLEEKYALRVSITNHRTLRSDLDLFVEEVLELGRHLTSKIQN